MRRLLSSPVLLLMLIVSMASFAFSQVGTAGSANPVSLAPVLSDFDGDGMADLNWHNKATGETTVWRMNGLNVTGTMLGMTISDTNWRPLLSADFNGDGKADLLWHNSSTNTNYLWMTNDSLWFDGYGLEPVNDPNWQIIGSADFDGDGKSDLLWRNSQTGDNYVWFMNGPSLKSTGWMQGVAGTDWQFVAIADFNGDGKPDLLWHNVTTGVYYIWLMDGTTIAAAASPGTITDPSWQIAAIADFNGDHRAEILWRNTSTGDDYMWMLGPDGNFASGAGVQGVVDMNWQIAAVGDLDGDKKADLVWRNTSTGANYVWFMNGSVLVNSGGITALTDQDWTLGSFPNSTVTAPTFNPAGGTYSTPQTVTLSTTTPGALINYTTDGSTPSATHGTTYGGPISVGSTTTIKAIAYERGMNPSSIVTATYTINSQNTVATPYFSPAPTSYTSPPVVTIATKTPVASIRYTTDGSIPSPVAGTLYTGPFTVSSTTTFNAIAYEDGMTPSAIKTATFTISVSGQVAAPVFFPAPGQYTTAVTVTLMVNSSQGASINYTTDGSDPSETAGTLYTGPITISNTTTFKAIAFKNKKADSVIATAIYTINLEDTVAAPVFSPAGGTFSSPQTVTMSTTTPGASIRYTENGLAPTPTTGILYTGPISVSTRTPIMAIAYQSGYNSSRIVTSEYDFTCANCASVATPAFDPPAGQFRAATPVTITSSTPGATIYYTTDGSIPSETNGTIYTGPVTMQVPENTDVTGYVTNASGVTMLKAVAIQSGSMPSDVFTGIYTIIDPLRLPPANSLVQGLAHMAYNVSAANWNNILNLWTNYLGFAVVKQTSTFALIKVNDQQFIELYQVPSITAPQYQLANYGFYVTDVEAFRQQMAAAGVSVPASSTINGLGNLSFFTTDPDGHQDEWLQYLPDSVTGQTLGKFMPSSELFGYINDFGEASANVTASVSYFGQFGFNPISTGSNHVSLPNTNCYLEMLTYQTLDQTQFGKHQKTQLVNFRGHDITDDALILQSRDLSIVQVTGEEGSNPVHNYIDLYDADLSRIRMIDMNY
jgi:hypothetical protein